MKKTYGAGTAENVPGVEIQDGGEHRRRSHPSRSRTAPARQRTCRGASEGERRRHGGERAEAPANEYGAGTARRCRASRRTSTAPAPREGVGRLGGRVRRRHRGAVAVVRSEAPSGRRAARRRARGSRAARRSSIEADWSVRRSVDAARYNADEYTEPGGIPGNVGREATGEGSHGSLGIRVTAHHPSCEAERSTCKGSFPPVSREPLSTASVHCANRY